MYETYHDLFVQTEESPTGLIWKPRPREMFESQRGFTTWNTQNAGKPAGAIKHSRTCSYYKVSIFKKQMRNHRIIFEMINGPIPKGMVVDHEDCNGLNNTPTNLRLCSHSQNHMNSRVSATVRVPFKGVMARNGRFVATISYQRKNYWLGTYDTPEEANAAYAVKAVELFGEFARW